MKKSLVMFVPPSSSDKRALKEFHAACGARNNIQQNAISQIKAGKTCQRTSWNNPFINAVVVMLAHKVGSCLNKEQQKRNIFGHTRTFSMKKVTGQVARK